MLSDIMNYKCIATRWCWYSAMTRCGVTRGMEAKIFQCCARFLHLKSPDPIATATVHLFQVSAFLHSGYRVRSVPVWSEVDSLLGLRFLRQLLLKL